MSDWWLGLRLLLLLSASNAAPIAAKRALGARWARPIDGGRLFVDGRPWLGPSKTWRGVVAGFALATIVAPALGFPPHTGALAGLCSMAGDALSSFVKRRLGVAPSGQAFGLDQVPEALLPLIALHFTAGVSWAQVAAVSCAFLLLETPAAWLSHRLGLRDTPY